MKKLLPTVLFCLILATASGQQQRKLSAYILTQYNHTLRDYTIGNNPRGVGVGLQAFYRNKTRFRLTAELTGDIYFEDDKVLRLTPSGDIPDYYNDVRGMVNLFVGTSYHPTNRLYLSMVAGPSFIGGETFFGMKPSIGFYFSHTQKWTGKISYITIFDRTAVAKQDFESISLAIGLRLF